LWGRCEQCPLRAQHAVPLHFNLGGKDAVVIDETADLDAAVSALISVPQPQLILSEIEKGKGEAKLVMLLFA
jgi:hypothetical protein